MMRIAVTGGIGSGKSFVCQELEHRGIRIYDCDSAAKRIMAENIEVKSALTELLGADVYKDGRLDKVVLAKYLLTSEANARRINEIVHPMVAADFLSSGYTWMECAILYTSGFNRYVDRTVCVTAPREVRIQRIMQRDSITREKAEAWIDCQMPQEEVAAKCDFVISNDGIQPVVPQIDRILDMLI